ncbi:mRNA interferase PemK [Betaproteobacteria bacterium]|nr:mRNA interferase PemK [Betaproteobacteria bacterium]
MVTIAAQGDFGKPRPALVIQSDLFQNQESLTVLPITSSIYEAPFMRVTLQPSAGNGLQKLSQVMVDKATTIKRDKVGPAFGHIAAADLVQVERCLAVFLGIA